MANEVANIAVNATMSADKDSGLGTVKDSVSVSGLGISTSGKRYYHTDGALGNPEVLVLNDGSIDDAFGISMSILTLHAIYIRNNSGGTIQIGAGADPINMFGDKVTDTFELVDNGVFMYLNPTGLTLGTDDTLTITGSAGVCDIIIIGAE